MDRFLRVFLAGWRARRGAPLVLRRYRRPGCVTSIEVRQVLPIIVWLLLLLWYVAAPAPLAALVLTAMSGLLLLAWLWARTMATRVAARRELHYAAVQVGDALEERLTLENASHLPVLWAEYVDQSDLPGYTLASVRAVDPDSTLHWRAQALCTRRGLFTLGPWELRLGDPFGFLRVRQAYADRQELLVYPPLAPLPPHLRPHSSVIGEQRRLRRPVRAETLNATTTRPYVAGDPLRHVHWPTSARHDALYTKLFEPESTATIWLLPDFDPGVHLTLQADDQDAASTATEELMVLLVASLADYLLRHHLSVGLLAHTGAPVVVPPQPGRAHLWRLLRALAPLHTTCPWPLAEALGRLQAPLLARHRLVIVTPSLDADWPRALRLVGQRGGVDCLLIDLASYGGPTGAERCAQVLAEQDVAAQVVRRGELGALTPAYGELRRWEFMTLGTGRAIARQTPRRWQAEAEPEAARG